MWRKHTEILLIGQTHTLERTFNVEAFPESFFNDNQLEPFVNLSSKRTIEKITIKPEFCTGDGSDHASCVPVGQHVTLLLPEGTGSGVFKLEFRFSVEFQWVIFSGEHMFGLPQFCTGDFCNYCPTVIQLGTENWSDQ